MENLGYYQNPTNYAPPEDRSVFGFWVEWEIRIAHTDRCLADIGPLDTGRSLLVLTDKDGKLSFFPYVTYGIRGRPEQIPEMIELIKSGKVPRKQEGHPTECLNSSPL